MLINELRVLRHGDGVLWKCRLSTSTYTFRFPWDTCKSLFLVNNAQGCTALGKCICGRVRPGCKTDSREEGIQNSGRLAGAQAKPEREAEHVCPVELDEIQSGIERTGLKDPCLQSKGEELKFQPNKFSDFFFCLHTEFNLISVLAERQSSTAFYILCYIFLTKFPQIYTHRFYHPRLHFTHDLFLNLQKY